MHGSDTSTNENSLINEEKWRNFDKEGYLMLDLLTAIFDPPRKYKKIRKRIQRHQLYFSTLPTNPN
jgi:hypothetical protein